MMLLKCLLTQRTSWPKVNKHILVFPLIILHSRIFYFLCFLMKKAFIQLHIAVLLAGFTGVLGRLITLNEGLLVWYRLMFTAATLWIIAFFQKKARNISFKNLIKIFGVGAVAALHWVTFYGSIKYAKRFNSLSLFFIHWIFYRVIGTVFI